MDQFIIETSALSKYYKKQKGIENINLRIAAGEVYGFLGPNGAGKSTTIRLILNLIQPTSGQIKIFGREVRSHYFHIFKEVGNVPGEFKLYEDLTGSYFLKYMTAVSTKEAVLQQELIHVFQLTPRDLEKKIKYYSHGMKQKLAIIQALQCDPQLLIMDEPSEGLDPINKNILYHFVQKFKSEGKTVFFSSHYLAEVEKICDRVGLVRDGNLIAEEKINDLKKKTVRKMDITFSVNVDPQHFQMPGVKLSEHHQNHFIFLVSGDINLLLKKITEYRITNLIFPEPTLEETFLTYYN
jgi:ABC-2 type transport system ATP-binding protein